METRTFLALIFIILLAAEAFIATQFTALSTSITGYFVSNEKKPIVTLGPRSELVVVENYTEVSYLMR